MPARAPWRRHVTGLAAALFLVERAVLPFLVVHLLGKRSDHLAIRTERLGNERVARRAQLGLPDVRGLRLHESCHGAHD